MRANTTVIILLVIVLTSCTLMPKPSDQDFDTRSKIVREFAVALLSADAESAKILSAPGQWHKIDEWVKTYQPIRCNAEETNTVRESFVPPELSGGSWFTSGRYDEQSGAWLVDVSYDCQAQNVNYCFEMNGTRLEKINEEWQIIGWDTIREKNNSNPSSSSCQ